MNQTPQSRYPIYHLLLIFKRATKVFIHNYVAELVQAQRPVAISRSLVPAE